MEVEKNHLVLYCYCCTGSCALQELSWCCSEWGLLFIALSADFSLQWLLLRWRTGSRHMGLWLQHSGLIVAVCRSGVQASRAVAHGLYRVRARSCVYRQPLHHVEPSWTRYQPVFPALADRFLFTPKSFCTLPYLPVKRLLPQLKFSLPKVYPVSFKCFSLKKTLCTQLSPCFGLTLRMKFLEWTESRSCHNVQTSLFLKSRFAVWNGFKRYVPFHWFVLVAFCFVMLR